MGTFTRGSGLQKKDFVEVGEPCIHYGQIYTYYGLSATETKSFIEPVLWERLKKANPHDLIIAITSENVEDVCKAMVWEGEGQVAFGGHATSYTTSLNSRYVAYWFQTENFFKQKKKLVKGTKVIEMSPDNMAKIRIPVPPMAVQEEIVRVLDSFAELEARRRQYAHYPTSCSTSQREDVSWLTLGEVCKSVCSGGTPNKSHSEYYENANIPWLRTHEVVYTDVYETQGFISEEGLRCSSAKWIPANCVIVAISGASAGRCCINKIPLTTNQHCLNMEIDESKAHYRYVFHCVCNQYDELIAKKEGARGDLNASRIKSLRIPLSSLAEQRRIVSILDRFDALTTSLTDGLPAEIEARRKQYAYWRDKLLAFPEKPAA